MILRVALGIVGSVEDAQDVAQQTLLSAWLGLDGFRGESSISTWLYQIARRHALNSVARAARAAHLADQVDRPDPQPEPAQLYAQRARDRELHEAVVDLPVHQAQVIGLFHFDEQSYSQIALRTGLSEPAVRSHLFRARRNLAANLARRDPAEP